MTVVVVALFVVLDMVSNDPARTSAQGEDPLVVVTEDPVEEEDPKEQEKAPSEAESEPEDEPEETEKKPAKKKAEEEGSAPKLKTKGIQVQVLNGTSASEADDLMADKLARLGYTVVAVSPSSKAYPETVVFWTGDAADVGARLAERFGWKLEPAPSNLSSEVQLHLMVGDDEV